MNTFVTGDFVKVLRSPTSKYVGRTGKIVNMLPPDDGEELVKVRFNKYHSCYFNSFDLEESSEIEMVTPQRETQVLKEEEVAV